LYSAIKWEDTEALKVCYWARINYNITIHDMPLAAITERFGEAPSVQICKTWDFTCLKTV